MLYNEAILISGTRADGRMVSVPGIQCRYLDDGISDDMPEGMRGKPDDMASFFFRIDDWPYTTPPQAGDSVRRESDGRRFVIGRVSRLGDCYSVSARGR